MLQNTAWTFNDQKYRADIINRSRLYKICLEDRENAAVIFKEIMVEKFP